MPQSTKNLYVYGQIIIWRMAWSHHTSPVANAAYFILLSRRAHDVARRTSEVYLIHQFTLADFFHSFADVAAARVYIINNVAINLLPYVRAPEIPLDSLWLLFLWAAHFLNYCACFFSLDFIARFQLLINVQIRTACFVQMCIVCENVAMTVATHNRKPTNKMTNNNYDDNKNRPNPVPVALYQSLVLSPMHTSAHLAEVNVVSSLLILFLLLTLLFVVQLSFPFICYLSV